MKSRVNRALLLAVVAALVPACGGSSSSSGGGGGGTSTEGQWWFGETKNLSLDAPQNSTFQGDVNDFDCDTDIQVDSSGRVHVTWWEDTGSSSSLLYSLSNGTTWSKPVSIWGDHDDYGRRTATGPDGAFWSAIKDHTSPVNDIWLRKVSSPTSMWPQIRVSDGVTAPVAGDEATLANGTNVDEWTVLVGSDNIVHLVWDQQDAAGFTQVWHRAVDGVTGAFSTNVTRVTAFAALNGVNGDGDTSYQGTGSFTAVLDSANNVHIVWAVDVDNDAADADANGVADAADTATDMASLRYRFVAAGLNGALSAEQNPMPGAPHFTLVAAITTVPQVQGIEVSTDAANRVHLCVSLDRESDGNSDEAFYNVRSAGAAGTWGGALDLVTGSADVPGGNLDMLNGQTGYQDFCCAVNPADGTVHFAWMDYDPAGPGHWYLRYKRRTIGGATFAAQTATLLDDDLSDNEGNEMCCGVDASYNFIVVYDREQTSDDTSGSGGENHLFGAYVRVGSAYSRVNDRVDVCGLQGSNGIICCEFRGSNAMVLWDSDELEFGNNSPFASTRSGSGSAWAGPFVLDKGVDRANGLPDDGWGGYAGAAIDGGGRFWGFFDQFATHPEPIDSLNDLAQDTGNGVLWNDPWSYDDPNTYEDSYDFFATYRN